MTSTMLLWPTQFDITLVIVLAVIMTSSGCPDECACSKSTRVVNCRARSLNDTSLVRVIQQLPANMLIEIDIGANSLTSTRALQTDRLQIHRLTLDGCEIATLTQHAFRHMHFVEFIDLSRNLIDRIDPDAFRGLRLLRELHLSFNRLSTLTGRLFDSLTLNGLSLDNNAIAHIDRNAFQSSRIRSLNVNHNRVSAITSDVMAPLVDSLRELSISNNSVALVISGDALEGMSLTSLDVSSSHLISLSFLENVASVERLFIGNNKELRNVTVSWNAGLALTCQEAHLNNVGLTTLSPELMISLRSVRTLDLSANRLRSIDSVVFKHAPNLRELNLSGNLLTTLGDDVGIFLGSLERLDLSSNAITSLPDQSFDAMNQLTMLNLSANLLQTLPPSLATGVTSLARLDINNNRLHCNCELSWFKRWIDFAGRDVLVPGARCSSPISEELVTVVDGGTDFPCSIPTITSVTASMNVREGSDVLLSCTAQSDPAPSVTWSSPTNEVVTISPSEDRLQRRLSAIWQLRRARSSHSGWYECNAMNRQGNTSAYTYVHVITNSGVGQVDMTGLVYPDKPQPFTTQRLQHHTSGSRPVTDAIHRSTSFVTPTTHDVTTDVTVEDDVTTNSTISTSNYLGGHILTSQAYVYHREVGEATIDDGLTPLVIALSAGGAALVVILLFIVCIVRRKRKQRGRYHVSRTDSVISWLPHCCCRYRIQHPADATEQCKLNESLASTRLDHDAVRQQYV